MSQENFHTIESATQFKELMSADLERLSVVNFWASWAQVCEKVNDSISELAKTHPRVLFLKIEAETQEEIAESFEVAMVPTVLILRGHTLLGRITGADTAALSATLTKYDTTKPLSHTDESPAKPQPGPPLEVEKKVEKKDETTELNARLRQLMDQDKVVLFMKGSPEGPRCGFSRKIVALLQGQNVKFTHFDILTDESVRQGLKIYNDWPTFPQLIVKGELVGGLDIVQEMIDNGEFQILLTE